MLNDFLFFIACLVCILLASCNIVYLVTSSNCKNYAEITGKNTKQVGLDYCYIETAEGWETWEVYRDKALRGE